MPIDASKEIDALKKAVEGSEQPRVGWFCNCAPYELIIAAGLRGFRVRSRTASSRTTSDTAPSGRLSAFACPYLRSTLDDALGDAHDGAIPVSGVFGVTCCEGMKRHFEIWNDVTRPRFAFLLDVPRIDSIASRHYLYQKIEVAVRAFEKAYDVRLPKRAIGKAVRDLNGLRAALRRLDALRASRPGAISNRHFHELVLLSMESPLEAATAALHSTCDRISRSRPGSTRQIEDKRLALVALSGNIIDDFSFYDALDELGGFAVFDDLCTGRRFYGEDAPAARDPLESVVGRIFNSLSCARSAEGKSDFSRFASEARKRGAAGIIFVSQRNCDATLIEQAKEAREAEGLGFKVLSLQIDSADDPFVRERLRSFLEMMARDVEMEKQVNQFV